MNTCISSFTRRVENEEPHECTYIAITDTDDPDASLVIYDVETALFLQRELVNFIAEKLKEQ